MKTSKTELTGDIFQIYRFTILIKNYFLCNATPFNIFSNNDKYCASLGCKCLLEFKSAFLYFSISRVLFASLRLSSASSGIIAIYHTPRGIIVRKSTNPCQVFKGTLAALRINLLHDRCHGFQQCQS